MKKPATTPKKKSYLPPSPKTHPAKYENICIPMPEIQSLPVPTARGRIGRWKSQNVDMTPMNGFFIRYDDILGLVHSLNTHAKDKKILGVRAYLGMHEFQSIKPDERYKALSVMFVGVEYMEGYDWGKDIIYGENNRSEIFDLTQPCPNCCDFTSPLYEQANKRKLPLSKLGSTKKKAAKKPVAKKAAAKKAVAKKPVKKAR